MSDPVLKREISRSARALFVAGCRPTRMHFPLRRVLSVGIPLRRTSG